MLCCWVVLFHGGVLCWDWHGILMVEFKKNGGSNYCLLLWFEFFFFTTTIIFSFYTDICTSILNKNDVTTWISRSTDRLPLGVRLNLCLNLELFRILLFLVFWKIVEIFFSKNSGEKHGWSILTVSVSSSHICVG